MGVSTMGLSWARGVDETGTLTSTGADCPGVNMGRLPALMLLNKTEGAGRVLPARLPKRPGEPRPGRERRGRSDTDSVDGAASSKPGGHSTRHSSPMPPSMASFIVMRWCWGSFSSVGGATGLEGEGGRAEVLRGIWEEGVGMGMGMEGVGNG